MEIKGIHLRNKTCPFMPRKPLQNSSLIESAGRILHQSLSNKQILSFPLWERRKRYMPDLLMHTCLTMTRRDLQNARKPPELPYHSWTHCLQTSTVWECKENKKSGGKEKIYIYIYIHTNSPKILTDSKESIKVLKSKWLTLWVWCFGNPTLGLNVWMQGFPQAMPSWAQRPLIWHKKHQTPGWLWPRAIGDAVNISSLLLSESWWRVSFRAGAPWVWGTITARETPPLSQLGCGNPLQPLHWLLPTCPSMVAHSSFLSLLALSSFQKRWMQRTPRWLERSLPKVSRHTHPISHFSPFLSPSSRLQASVQPGPRIPSRFPSLPPQSKVETLRVAARGTRKRGEEPRAVLPSMLLPAEEISQRNLWGNRKAAELPAGLQALFLFCNFPWALSKPFRCLDHMVIHLSWINFYLY